MADVDLNTQNNSSSTGSSDSQTNDSDNLSPWEVDLDLPDEPKESPPQVVGTLYDSANQGAAEQQMPLSVPQQPLENVGATLPAADFIPKQTQEEVLSSQLPPVPPMTPTLPDITDQPVVPVSQSPIQSQTMSGDIRQPQPQNEPELQPALQSQMTATSLTSNLPNLPAQDQPVPESKPLINADATSPNFISNLSDRIKRGRQILIALGGILVVIIAIIALTETGNLSIGAENIYGAIGLEKLWGGLSGNTSTAFYQSFSKLSQDQTFKIKGSISVSVDKTKYSPILSPLVLNYGTASVAYDQNISGGAVKATKADTTNSVYDSVIDGTSNNLNSSPNNSNADNSNSADSNTNSWSVYDDQSNYPSYTTTNSNSQDVNADIVGAFSPSGAEAVVKVKKTVGTADITLKSAGGKLWVQAADSNVKYATNASPDKWLEYSLSTLDNNSIQSSLFSPLSINGVSVSGKRSGNVEIGKVRCYKYDVDSFVPGDILTKFGISTDNVKSISGSVYIGISDHLPRRIILNMTGNSDFVVQSLNLSLDLYDYNVTNNFSEPATTDVLTPTGTTQTNSSQTLNTNDEKRKSDLASIKTALISYKTANGSYPVAKDILKLNATGNQLISLLVPKYLSALPIDPKDTDGWYYSYKSIDGTSFTLGARLENSSDTSAIITNGIPLYDLTDSSTTTSSSTSSTANANDLTRKANLQTIKDALAKYYADNSEYPISSSLLKIGEANILKTALVPSYISTLPTDPKSGWYYGYKSTDGQSYTLSAQLEDHSDSSATNVGGVYLYFLYNE